MAPKPDDKEEDDGASAGQQSKRGGVDEGRLANGKQPAEARVQAEEDEDEEEDDEGDEEPIFKYSKLTPSLSGTYRSGDATSAVLTTEDKMIIGTHNGNIHVYSLPTLRVLRKYQAHTAAVTAISVSPYTTNTGTERSSTTNGTTTITPNKGAPGSPRTSASPRSPHPAQQQQTVPASRSNSIFIGSASIDGNVCVASLVDPKDVMLRGFGRPVQSIALAPNFKSNRSYLSGGPAGKLILTSGGRAGTSSTSSTTGGVAAASAGWLSSMGLASSTAKDTVLHSGEGSISTIKWSHSGRYVAWINEQGIKIMRSNHQLENADPDIAWRRISHIDRPTGPGWEEMKGVWKGRVEWVDERTFEMDNRLSKSQQAENQELGRSTKKKPNGSSQEKLVVGWGGTVWVVNVHSGGSSEKDAGRAEIATLLRTDCIISGLSLYTPTLLLVLAYIIEEDDDDEEEESTSGPSSKPRPQTKGSRTKRAAVQKVMEPELRLIDLNSSEEVSADTLSVGRFASLSATDYHLAVVPGMVRKAGSGGDARVPTGTFEMLGGSLWNAGMNATGIFSSGASIRSADSKSEAAASLRGIETVSSTRDGGNKTLPSMAAAAVPNPELVGLSTKIFIHSAYDCVLATKRDLADHLDWLLGREHFREAWNLIDKHPEIVTNNAGTDTTPSTPTKEGSNVSVSEWDSTSAAGTAETDGVNVNNAAEKEKRRIGELWVEQLLGLGDWSVAGETCGRVLGTSSRWEHWVWVFAQAKRFDEITPYIPTTRAQRGVLPGVTYELVLAHYLAHDRRRFRELLDRWQPGDLYDITPVAVAVEDALQQDFEENDQEDNEEWRLLKESLAKLYFAEGQYRKALECHIQLRDGDAAMSLIRDYHLLDAVADDIPGIVRLRVSREQIERAPLSELEAASAEIISMLAEEAYHGIVPIEKVVDSLGGQNRVFLYLYLRALWTGELPQPSEEEQQESRPERDTRRERGRGMVDEHADIAVDVFSAFGPPSEKDSLLMDFLRTSEGYDLEQARRTCETRGLVREQIYLLGQTGQTKRALFLMIEELDDVVGAIGFAKAQDDRELWQDLLEWAMDPDKPQPRVIRGLLEEVGTAIDPLDLVRRIPRGLEIEGLRGSLLRLLREYEVQHSVCAGAARIVRGEVNRGMDTLRAGRRRGIGEGDRGVAYNPEEAQQGMHRATCPLCKKPLGSGGFVVVFACREAEEGGNHAVHLACIPGAKPLPAELHTAEKDPEDDDGATWDGDSATTRGRVGTKVLSARLIQSHLSRVVRERSDEVSGDDVKDWRKSGRIACAVCASTRTEVM